MINNFQPDATAGVTIAVTTSSARVQIYSTATTRSVDIMIGNAGTDTVFINLGDSSVTATATTSMFLLGGTTVILNSSNFTHLAAVSASGTPTIYAKTGMGA